MVRSVAALCPARTLFSSTTLFSFVPHAQMIRSKDSARATNQSRVIVAGHINTAQSRVILAKYSARNKPVSRDCGRTYNKHKALPRGLSSVCRGLSQRARRCNLSTWRVPRAFLLESMKMIWRISGGRSMSCSMGGGTAGRGTSTMFFLDVRVSVLGEGEHTRWRNEKILSKNTFFCQSSLIQP